METTAGAASASNITLPACNDTAQSILSCNDTVQSSVAYNDTTMFVALKLRDVYIWVLVAVGLPCNAACIATVLFMRVTTATFYVALLAVADSLALIFKVIYHQVGVQNAPSCYLMYVNNFFSCYANWVLVLIVFQRFYAVCFPLKIKGAFTKTRIYISAAVLALSLFVVVVVPTFFLREWTSGNCDWKSEVRYFGDKVWDVWIIASLYSYIPFVIIVVFTVLIIVRLYRHRRARKNITGTSATSEGNAERAISVMLVCAGLMFLLLTLPACIFVLFISDLYDLSVSRELGQWYLIYQVVTFLSDANHAVNFFVYFLTTSAFRQSFVDLIVRYTCRRRSSLTTTKQTGNETQEAGRMIQHTAC